MKVKQKYAAMLTVTGVMKGQLYMFCAESYEKYKEGDIVKGGLGDELRLLVKFIEIEVDVPDDLDALVDAHKDKVKQDLISSLEDQLKEARAL